MLTKEQYIAKEIELTAAYEAADKAFDKNPCKPNNGTWLHF